jgi:tetratricopeptide (TPR) repeat protein
MRKALIYLAVFAINIFLVKGQQRKIDSVITLLQTDKEDTNKVIHLNYLARHLKSAAPDKAIDYANRALSLAQTNTYPLGVAEAYSNLGNAYCDLGHYPRALDYYLKSLALAEKLGNKKVIAKNKGNLGVMYWEEGDYLKALSYDLDALKMYEALGIKTSVALTNGNIAGVYYQMGNKDRALTYYNKALAMDEELNDKEGTAIDLGNIGSLYKDMGKYDEALDNDFKAIKLDNELHDERTIAAVTGNIGNVYTIQKNYVAAEKYLKKALALADSVNYIDVERDVNQSLADLYYKTGRWQKSIQYYLKYNAVKDSLFNIDKSEQIGKIEAKSEYDKQLLIQQAKEEQATVIANTESKHQKTITLFVGAIAITIALIAGIIFRSLRITRSQKTIIEEQKTLVEEKNNDIIASINYAKRIQDALLKEEEHVSQHLPEHFILFKPKDIVSGDFYWTLEKDNHFYLAAADCTGHGVPGAMMSMLGIAFLNEITSTAQLLTPAEILDQLRNRIVQELRQTGRDEESKDGMDISLIRMNTETKEFHWAGANNPLYIIKNRILTEIKPNKQPVSYYPQMNPFTNHVLTLEKGTEFYLFTDGTADQFGGPNGKKMKYSHFKEVLISLYPSPIKEQKKLLNDAFNDWKGNLEQVDDVLVIGVLI